MSHGSITDLNELTERSIAAVTTLLPSLYHVILGVGSPSALQPKVTGSFFVTEVSSGCSVILGAKEADAPEKTAKG